MKSIILTLVILELMLVACAPPGGAPPIIATPTPTPCFTPTATPHATVPTINAQNSATPRALLPTVKPNSGATGVSVSGSAPAGQKGQATPGVGPVTISPDVFATQQAIFEKANPAPATPVVTAPVPEIHPQIGPGNSPPGATGGSNAATPPMPPILRASLTDTPMPTPFETPYESPNLSPPCP